MTRIWEFKNVNYYYVRGYIPCSLAKTQRTIFENRIRAPCWLRLFRDPVPRFLWRRRRRPACHCCQAAARICTAKPSPHLEGTAKPMVHDYSTLLNIHHCSATEFHKYIWRNFLVFALSLIKLNYKIYIYIYLYLIVSYYLYINLWVVLLCYKWSRW